MASKFVAGNKTTFAETVSHILDLRDGLSFLKPRNDGVGLLKRIGMNGFVAKNVKHLWNIVALATRRETVTVLIGDTDFTVADGNVYQVNDLCKIESEIVRVTALKSATEITVTRGYAGTAAAAHAGKTMILLGAAAPENSGVPKGRSDLADQEYNYVQTFDMAVDLSNDEIMTANVDGNPMTGNVARRTIEWYQKFAQAFFYGVRYQDTTNKINVMGGLTQFITTNVTNVAGALTLAAIDAKIKAIVDAGGDPKLMIMGTLQKGKLDALDATKQTIGKKETVGGNLRTLTYQSGIMDHEIDILVDPTVLDDQLWILDTDFIKLGYLAGNGKSGSLAVVDATTPGVDGEVRKIIGKYTLEVLNEKAHAYLYGLT